MPTYDAEKCCFVSKSGAQCESVGRFWIGGATQRPDDYVYACADHVADLERDGDRVVKMETA